jgi:hypothetical protein
LCWQTVEQQSIPALAIASAVSIKFRNHGNLQKINILRLFRSLKAFPDRNTKLTKQNSFHDSFYFLARQTSMNSWLEKLYSTTLLDNSAQLFGMTALPANFENLERNSRKDFQ